MSTATQQKRYPGVKPFETTERDLFFGRDRDIENLLDLLWLEKLVVLFGKSGYGKSSLINAGLLPEIEREAISIVVRFGAYVEGQTLARLDNLRDRIDASVPNNPDAAFLDDLNLPESLWLLVKRKQGPKQSRFVLIFDQFEEFFTYPKSVQQAFKEQLAELLYTEVPQAARDRNDSLSAEQQAFIATPFDAKALFAIRADRMSLLDSMKDKLPAILQKRYELRGLSEVQAREAIERPAQREGYFASSTFAYSPEALRAMTQKLAETKSAQRSGIEAFQLQILCEYLEDKIIKGEIPGNRIEPHHFADQIDEVFEGYYQRLLDKLDPSTREAARLLIEEKLIFEDESTGEARRLPGDSGVLLRERGITQGLLDRLESAFLLRREATSTGGFNYEVSHDTLIAPILKSKAERKIRELAEMEKREAERKRRRLLAGLLATGMILAIVIGVVFYFYKLKGEAEISKNEALSLRDRSEQKTDSLRIILKEIGFQKDSILSLRDRSEQKTDSLRIALKEIGFQKDSINNQQILIEIKRIEAESALKKLEDASLEIASLLITDSNKLIYEIKFDKALEKLRAAIPLKSKKSEVAKGLIELAYFYNEAGKYQLAREIIENLFDIRSSTNAKKLFNNFIYNDSTRFVINQILKDLDSIWCDSLKTRYYPEMKNVKGSVFCYGALKTIEECDKSAFSLPTIQDFSIAYTETTVWQYFLYATAMSQEMERPSWGWAGDNPVVNISWYEAVTYCIWLNNQLGNAQVYNLPDNYLTNPNELDNNQRLKWKTVINWAANGYRLPTQFEWEYAARGGINCDKNIYSGADDLITSGWFKANSKNRTQPVGSLMPNSLGLFDMSGNIFEWCWDWTDPLALNDSDRIIAPKEGQYPTLRGGSWNYLAKDSEVLSKGYENPKVKKDYIGFRVVFQN